MERGQQALQFIMTYGWALVVILLAGGALWFTFGGEKFFVTEKCVAGPGFYCGDFIVDESAIIVNIKNSQGKDIEEFKLSYSGCNSESAEESLENGEGNFFAISACNFEPDEIFNGIIDMSYKFIGSTIEHSKSISMVGIVQSGTAQSGGGNPGSGGSGGDSGGGYIPDGGTVLLYKFEEGDVGIVEDSSGNENDGTLEDFEKAITLYHFDDSGNIAIESSGNVDAENAVLGDGSCNPGDDSCPTWVNGYSGGGLEFDGVDDYLDLDGGDGENPIFDNAYNEKTAEFWYKTDTGSGRQLIYEEGGWGNGYNIYIDAIRSYVGVWRANSNVFMPISTNIDEWHHIAFVYECVQDMGGNGLGLANFKLYYDGNKINELGFPYCNTGQHVGDDGIGKVIESTEFHDGDSISGADYFFDGIIDEVVFYGDALSDEDILKSYELGKARIYPSRNDGIAGYGGALLFDGEGDYVEIDNFDVDLVQNEFVWEAWIYYEPTSDEQIFFGDEVDENYFGINDGGYLTTSFNLDDTGVVLQGTTGLTEGWHHVVAQYDGVAGKIGLYLDGELDRELGHTGQLSFGDQINVGIFKENDRKPFTGKIDEVRISDVVRY